MAYPKDLLSTGEQVIVHRHPHFKMLIMPIFAFVIAAAAGIWGIVLAAEFPPPWDLVAAIAIGVVVVLVLVLRVFAPFIRWRTTHFVVTTDRVIAREGVITRTGIDIPMRRIHSVRFEHGLLDRIFGCGTLFIESASEEPLRFDDIPRVEQVHTDIYRFLNDNPYDDYTDDETELMERPRETRRGW
ncbi:PH domain-containing protein [Haloechinothrix salitolerans]|uniref:PH domain-containing protein n=1 Tax=Haloechinothrix salitolerans TaxID=926830 RepID=A0ABW2C7M9_9PSEU